jgi:hypothetical protein
MQSAGASRLPDRWDRSPPDITAATGDPRSVCATAPMAKCIRQKSPPAGGPKRLPQSQLQALRETARCFETSAMCVLVSACMSHQLQCRTVREGSRTRCSMGISRLRAVAQLVPPPRASASQASSTPAFPDSWFCRPRIPHPKRFLEEVIVHSRQTTPASAISFAATRRQTRAREEPLGGVQDAVFGRNL